jgi:hypothetical protein
MTIRTPSDTPQERAATAGIASRSGFTEDASQPVRDMCVIARERREILQVRIRGEKGALPREP